MTGRDGYGDPIPPGHGETAATEETIMPFAASGPAWRPAPLPPMFGVPLCDRCHYYHEPGEACRR